MSCSSNLRTNRRSFLLALLTLPWTGGASAAAPTGLRRWGSGTFRRFGFLVYEATLWAADDPQQPPLALRLDYKRSIAGQDIAAASVKEMRKLVVDPQKLDAWGERMAQIFPNVRDGDHILGVWQADGVRFLQGDRMLGSVPDAAFARAFFGIWLDERTSAPELRAALLRPPAG
ncbi:MAG: chalcone isomerase family protein [Rhodocyclaceae bacterium]|nr:chalcone isomerase family protein [Rhodocyclaceae bacterium]